MLHTGGILTFDTAQASNKVKGMEFPVLIERGESSDERLVGQGSKLIFLSLEGNWLVRIGFESRPRFELNRSCLEMGFDNTIAVNENGLFVLRTIGREHQKGKIREKESSVFDIGEEKFSPTWVWGMHLYQNVYPYAAAISYTAYSRWVWICKHEQIPGVLEFLSDSKGYSKSSVGGTVKEFVRRLKEEIQKAANTFTPDVSRESV